MRVPLREHVPARQFGRLLAVVATTVTRILSRALFQLQEHQSITVT